MPREDSHAQRTTAISTALAALLACAVLLPLLGHKPLAEWDEGIYAEVSREMLGGSWIVPHWNLHLWLEKPPLMLWITAIFFKLFGVTEFWARAGSTFSGIAIVALLHGGQTQEVQCQSSQCAPSGADGVRAIGAVLVVRRVGPLPVAVQCASELQAHGFTHGMYAWGVDNVELLGPVGFRWQ